MAENTWDCLDHIKFSRFRFNLRAIDFLPLPNYWGQVFDIAFRHSFKNATCSRKNTDCKDCEHREKCTYLYVFETPLPSGSPKKYLLPSHPFIMDPPLDRKRSYDPGEIITFEITLIGRAVEHLKDFIVTFEKMGRAGLGTEKAKFRIENVEGLKGSGDRAVIYIPGEEAKLKDFEILSGKNLASPFPSGKNESLAVDFLTPIQVKYNPKLQTNLYFYTFAAHLFTRLDMLSYVYCGKALEADFKGLIIRSHWIRTKESNLFWVNSEPTAEDSYYRMGGYTGSIIYEGNLEEFYPFLVLGQYLHAGKGATYGFGKYRINRG